MPYAALMRIAVAHEPIPLFSRICVSHETATALGLAVLPIGLEPEPAATGGAGPRRFSRDASRDGRGDHGRTSAVGGVPGLERVAPLG